MKKRSLNIIILLSVFAVFLGGYIVMNRINKNSEAETADEGTVLFEIDSDFITSLEWKYSSGDVSLNYNSDEDSWQYSKNTGFPLDSTYTDTMLTALSSIKYTRTLSDINDYSDYGLDSPSIELSFVADGDTYTIDIGITNGVTDCCYIRLNDSSDIYLVDTALSDAFSHSLYDIALKDTVPDMTDITSMQINGSEYTFLKDGSDTCYTPDYVWFLKNSDGSLIPLGTEKITELSSSITGMTWNSCVSYAPDSDELADYGLDSPSVTAKIAYTETETIDTGENDDDGNAITEEKSYDREFILYIGSAADEDATLYYAKCSLSDMIYTISSDLYKALNGASAETLMPDDVCLMDWQTVDSFTISADGKIVDISVSSKETTDDDGNVSYSYTYSINGETVNSELVQAFADRLSSLASEGTSDSYNNSAAPEITVVFHRNTDDDFAEMTFTLTPYDSSFYIAGFNGYQRILVNKKDVAELILDFENIA